MFQPEAHSGKLAALALIMYDGESAGAISALTVAAATLSAQLCKANPQTPPMILVDGCESAFRSTLRTLGVEVPGDDIAIVAARNGVAPSPGVN